MCNATKQANTITKGHQRFIEDVASLAIENLEPEERAKCKAHIVYGIGRMGQRGVTYYDTWKTGNGDEKMPAVEVCAMNEESRIQVAGTCVHEIAHVLAGPLAGHGKDWKAACHRLGLRRAKAAGMRYSLAAFEPGLRHYVARHAFKDGKPYFFSGGALTFTPPTGSRSTTLKPCSQGIGTRGGKSRGTGSGSRMRKYVCGCEPAIIIRTARDDLDATCNTCGEKFDGPVTQG